MSLADDRNEGTTTPGLAWYGTAAPVELSLEGDAKAVVLTNGKRRFKVPGKAPNGKWTVLAAFGDETLAKKGTLEVPKAASATVVCTEAKDSCEIK